MSKKIQPMAEFFYLDSNLIQIKKLIESITLISLILLLTSA